MSPRSGTRTPSCPSTGSGAPLRWWPPRRQQRSGESRCSAGVTRLRATRCRDGLLRAPSQGDAVASILQGAWSEIVGRSPKGYHSGRLSAWALEVMARERPGAPSPRRLARASRRRRTCMLRLAVTNNRTSAAPSGGLRPRPSSCARDGRSLLSLHTFGSACAGSCAVERPRQRSQADTLLHGRSTKF